MPSGSARLTSAPASISARVASSDPCRAANSSGVSPPRGNVVSSVCSAWPFLSVRKSEDLALGRLQHVRPAVHLGATRGQRLHDRGVVLGRGPHQRRLPLPLLLGVHARTCLEQQVDGRGVARPRREHQRRLALGPGGIGTGAALEQGIDDRDLPVRCGQQQRRHAVSVRRARLGPGPEQCVDEIRVARAHRPVQRRRAVHLRRVDVGALLDQRPHRRRIASPGRLHDPRVRRLGRGNGQRQQQCSKSGNAVPALVRPFRRPEPVAWSPEPMWIASCAFIAPPAPCCIPRCRAPRRTCPPG